MCPARVSTKNRGVLSDANFKKAIDDLLEHDYSGEVHLYGQGEFLLDKRIFEMIDYVHDKLPRARIILISNLVAMNNEMMAKLLRAPIASFTTSIYALDAEAYKKICGRDNFVKVITNLIKFSKAWAKRQPFQFVVYLMSSEYNHHDSNFIKYFIKKIPCSSYAMTCLVRLRGMFKRKKTIGFFAQPYTKKLKYQQMGIYRHVRLILIRNCFLVT